MTTLLKHIGLYVLLWLNGIILLALLFDKFPVLLQGEAIIQAFMLWLCLFTASKLVYPDEKTTLNRELTLLLLILSVEIFI